jgi:hypothetical protein
MDGDGTYTEPISAASFLLNYFKLFSASSISGSISFNSFSAINFSDVKIVKES